MNRGLILAILILPFLIFGLQTRRISSTETTAAQDTGLSRLPAVAATQPATAPASQLIATKTPAPTTAPAYVILRGHEGFWQLAKTPDGVWWFVSPAGERQFLNGVTTVQPYQLARDRNGPNYISHDWTGGTNDEGDLKAWAATTLQRVHEFGFKSLGAWSHPIFHQYDIPATRDLNVWTWMGLTKRFYSADWATIAEKAVRAQVEVLRDNRNLVGYFIDNELDWSDAVAGPGTYFDYLPNDDPSRQEVIRIIRALWATPEAFSADWQTDLKDWKDLEALKTLSHQASAAYGRLHSAWLTHLAEDYFRLTTSLIRAYDPNHLILGVRFKGVPPAEVVRGSKLYTDAQSINYYVSDARLDLEVFRMLHEQSGQPLILSEYAFHALDGRSGNRNTVGFSAQVLDQQARADGYRLLTTHAARVPYMVSADWFQWADEPPSGRSYDGEDVNFGVVDIDDRPYDLLVQAVRSVTPQLNGLHEASAADDQKEVWRESFASKPIASVPYLSSPIILNGELSDWPAQAKLQGIRYSQTVGLDRSPLPLPNVYLGWRSEGLYLGFEVFDNDVQGAAAKGWWWTRDCVEFWLSTRPVAADQENYGPYCHQFFFVPQDPAANNGVAGAVGQWHRPGDALADNLIPHPDIRHAERLLADRYVVEMFIPVGALHGFEPITQPTLAFNIHTRNYQHAIECFWSAPKDVHTQLRPKTWGTLNLEAPPKPAPAIAMPMSTTVPAGM